MAALEARIQAALVASAAAATPVLAAAPSTDQLDVATLRQVLPGQRPRLTPQESCIGWDGLVGTTVKRAHLCPSSFRARCSC
jgi:hypothetical protein